MLARYEAEGKKLDQQSLIQTYRGKKLFVFSELLRFYLDMGYVASNITIATQYLGERCLEKFISKAVKMRIKATYENDENKANTAKIISNSSYGKLLENPAHYTSAKLVPDKHLYRYIRKPNLNSWNSLDTECGTTDLNEVILDRKKLKDHFPVHVGNAVLQHSKLHFLR